ncbi:hypothetical protein OE88DRAFT_1649910 [Heliocybe sulcata]|uniref:Uncharacterized protein n=1 Tax=Heliocybe sulcata TaxID=5364 RepID=A0A5C3NFP2_9AGAM|nr:hypothetical protein OE88DRAFT_1649910 [Heliocybe sulcata]
MPHSRRAAFITGLPITPDAGRADQELKHSQSCSFRPKASHCNGHRSTPLEEEGHPGRHCGRRKVRVAWLAIQHIFHATPPIHHEAYEARD